MESPPGAPEGPPSGQPSELPDLIGARVGSYTIESLLGVGGMGSVYRGMQREIGKRVAIKFMADEFNGRPDVVGRFKQEALAVNVIGHENIVDIFDFGVTSEGRNYFVMELLDGPSLERQLTADGALSTRRAVDVARQIASALHAAHGRNIVHRDLKPDNVFLVKRAGREDFVKLLDFGIAKLTGGDGPVGGRTQTGMILGTPGYMAPEQAGGGTVDARTDIYALGVMLYRMLGGRLPFDGGSLAQIFRQQLTEEPKPLRSLRADVPAALDFLTVSMLAREQSERPQTMAEVAGQLEMIAHKERLGASVVWYAGTPAPVTDAAMAVADPPAGLTQPDKIAAGTAEVASGARRRALAETGRRTQIMAAVAIVGLALIISVAMLITRRQPTPAPAATARAAVAAPPSVAPPPAPPVASPVAAAPAPAPAPAGFTVRIDSEPPGAQILDADHKPTGSDTPASITLQHAGPVFVHRAGFREERVEVTPGQSPARVVLRRLAVTSRPPGAAAAAPPSVGLPSVPAGEREPAAPRRAPVNEAPPKKSAGGIELDD